MNKVLVPLAEGFEEMEAIILVDLLRRANIIVETASLSSSPVTASRNTVHVADRSFEVIDPKEFSMVVLPGGGPGTKQMLAHKPLHDLLMSFHREQKWIGAICAAPNVLRQLGILDGKRFVAFPTSLGLVQEEKAIHAKGERLVIDGNIITSIGPGSAFEMGLQLISILRGEEVKKQVEDALYLPKLGT